MLKKLADIRIVIIFILLLGLVGLGVFGYLKLQEKDNTIANQQSQISDLEYNLSEIGELVPVYVLADSVISGKKVEESDVTLIDVPVGIADNLITDYESELEGKFFKLSMGAGTVITRDCVDDFILESDMRIADIILDVVPVGLQVGDYVDIRIKYGTGADYIGIVHRQVQAIYDKCLKLIVTEKDLQMYSSMQVDNIAFNTPITISKDLNGDGKVTGDETERIDSVGALIYATVYLEGGIQENTVVSYAPSRIVQVLMGKDENVNVKDLSETDLALYQEIRKAFNDELTSESLTLMDMNDKVLFASKIKDDIMGSIREAQKAYEKMLEEMEDEDY